MPTTLRVIDYAGALAATGQPPSVEPGDVWFDPYVLARLRPSPAFQALDGARLPIVLRLPDASGQGGSNWCPDALPEEPVVIGGEAMHLTPALDTAGGEAAWVVDEQTTALVPGEPCALTVTPGVRWPGQYRGACTGGVLTDNVEP